MTGNYWEDPDLCPEESAYYPKGSKVTRKVEEVGTGESRITRDYQGITGDYHQCQYWHQCQYSGPVLAPVPVRTSTSARTNTSTRTRTSTGTST